MKAAARPLACSAAFFATATLGPAATLATAAGNGGATIAATPQAQANAMAVRKITCLKGCSTIAATQPGSTLRFQGPLLNKGKRVVYLGGKGTADDVLAKLTVARSGSERLVTAVVPKRAVSGPVAVEIADGARSPASEAAISLPAPVVAIAAIEGNGPFFPIRGKWTMGTGTASFGGAGMRVHEGQDLFAKCGTPLVAAEGGKVIKKAFHARAGNYVVIQVKGAASPRAEAYMHLTAPALVEMGDDVAAGTQLGAVGETGRADGCHLHFELWDGYWQGVGGPGTPIDPRPTLKQWAQVGVPAALAR